MEKNQSKESKRTEEEKQTISRKKVFIQTVSGMAGAITIQLLHPFDLIKTRFQSHDSGPNKQNVVPKYSSLYDCIKKIVKEEGPTAFFRGAGISLVGNQVSYALFFAFYEINRQQIRATFNLENEFLLSFCASTLSAGCSSVLVQPIWVTKTRRLLDSQKGNDFKRLNSILKSIYKDHGVLGFYRGFSLSLALSLYGTVQLTSYSTVSENIKNSRKRSGGKPELTNTEAAIIGMGSRLIASLFLYPLTTIRTRFQQNQYFEGIEGEKYRSLTDIVRKTYKREGVKGFYKGVVPMTLRSMPSQGLFFLAYENMKKFACAALNVDFNEVGKK